MPSCLDQLKARGHKKKRRLHGALTVALFGVSVSVCGLPWVRLNVSPSLPRGFYRLHAVPPVLTRGQLVLVPAPALMRPWHAARAPLLKPVAGVGGDQLTMQDDHFFVNGVNYGLVHRSANGRPLPLTAVPLRVPAGEVCLASPAPRSLDCRYMGTTPVATIRAVATPLWIWE